MIIYNAQIYKAITSKLIRKKIAGKILMASMSDYCADLFAPIFDETRKMSDNLLRGLVHVIKH